MVKVEFPDGKRCYMDNNLHRKLLKARKQLLKDDDFIMVIDGRERSGKSVFAQQMARVMDETFTHERMCVSVDEFKEWIDKAEKYQAIVFDEAFRGFNSRQAMNNVNKVLIEKMMEIGQKNLIIIIVLPTVFMLEKYMSIHRARGLFHVYRKGNRRGFWVYFNYKKKQRLILKGQKNMNYGGKGMPRSRVKGRFLEQYVIDEDQYRAKKLEAFVQPTKVEQESKYKVQRDILLKLLKENVDLKWEKYTEYLNENGVKISRKAITNAISSVKDK